MSRDSSGSASTFSSEDEEGDGPPILRTGVETETKATMHHILTWWWLLYLSSSVVSLTISKAMKRPE